MDTGTARQWRTARLIMAAGLVAASAACASTAAGNARCAVESDNPHESNGTPGSIVGKARFGCDQKIDSVTGVVKIQLLSGGAWRDVTGPNDRTVTSPGAKKQYVVQAVLPCARGTFRTASQGYGYLGGVRSESTAWDYSQSSTDPCG